MLDREAFPFSGKKEEATIAIAIVIIAISAAAGTRRVWARIDAGHACSDACLQPAVPVFSTGNGWLGAQVCSPLLPLFVLGVSLDRQVTAGGATRDY